MNHEEKSLNHGGPLAGLPILHVSDVHSCYSDVHRTKLGRHLEVTLRFPECTTACPCPGNIPNIPIPAMHMYSKDGTMEEVGGGALIRSDALGSWEHVRDHEYSARYKFFIFSLANGVRTQTEVVTSEIELQGHDAFAATGDVGPFRRRRDYSYRNALSHQHCCDALLSGRHAQA